MNLALYRTTSEKTVVTKALTAISTKSGNLRAECDMLDPVMIVSGLSSSDLAANYAYIDSFGRYYFITDIRSIRTDLWEVSMHVDVLMTYSSTIRSQTAIIARQENAWNLHVPDSKFKLENRNILTVQQFTNGFTGPAYVLAIAGS